MRSYNRRLLLFGILATVVSAALVVLAVGVVRDPRPSTAEPRWTVRATTSPPYEPQPVETARSRELTSVLVGSGIVPQAVIRLDQPFKWQRKSYQGVSYGESYSASGDVVDVSGYHVAGLSVSVRRVDLSRLDGVLEVGPAADPGRCGPLDTTPERTCVERVLRDGTKAALTQEFAQGYSVVRAVRPNGSEIRVEVRGIGNDSEPRITAETMFAFAGLADLEM